MNILKKLFSFQTNKTKQRDFGPFEKLNKGDIYIDCGANVGQEIEVAIKTAATIYAFEPNPYAFKVLEEKYGGNKNVHLYNQAVLDKDGTTSLYFHENSDEDEIKWSTGSSLVESKSNVDKNKKTEVGLVDLASFVKELGKRIKLLKIDVEGVEYQIINKLIDTGAYNQVETILVETHAEKFPEFKVADKALRKKIKELKIKNINLDWI